MAITVSVLPRLRTASSLRLTVVSWPLKGSRKARTTVFLPFTSLMLPSQSCKPWVTSNPTRVTTGVVTVTEELNGPLIVPFLALTLIV